MGLGQKPDARETTLRREAAELERRHGGRLGVAVLDTGSGHRFAVRGDERFPFCSTYKALTTGLLLARADRGELRLDHRVTYGKEVLVAHSPVTERHVADGLTVAQLGEAAVTVSDNAAANLQLDLLGGPEGFTAGLRALGDRTTRLDRRETALNEALPGDPRDTTTPHAMLETLRKLLLGDALTPASRERLKGWMLDCRTGDARLRAGVPKGWRVADKTGTGERGATNDVALLLPPHRPPLLVVAFYVGSPAPLATREAVLARVGTVVSGL